MKTSRAAWTGLALVTLAGCAHERPGAAAPAAVSVSSAPPSALYLATADVKAMEDGALLLVAALRQGAPRGLVWHHEPMPEEGHGTIYHPAALRAFRALFAPPKRG